MKKIFTVLACLLAFGLGFAVMLGFRFWETHVTQEAVGTTENQKVITFIPQPIDFKSAPPSQSLSGSVLRIMGGATKLARNEKDPLMVYVQMQVLEDEQLIASPSGSFDVLFGMKSLFTVSPDSTIGFVSTNPKNFLVSVPSGIVLFSTDDLIATISARSLHGLFSLSQGKAQLSVDPATKIIEFKIASGSAQVGYIDKENKTQVVQLSEGESIKFDDATRKITKE